MKISEVWLREWVNPAVPTDELETQLSMAGLEVDSVTPAAQAFSGVVVGQIVECDQHPDADKLRVCKVAGDGYELVQVVCGAPNARVGIKIPFATVGAKLPGDFKITKAKLRGVESFGMLCSEVELKLGEDDSGLWELPTDAPIGEDLRKYLALNDNLIEIDLTPNRGDCLSVQGIAREVGVLNQCAVTPVKIAPVAATINDTLPVVLNAGDACPRYLGRVIRNVDVKAQTPVWMQERLRRADVRPISPAVDVTNYVMLELGQPMHAFDLDKLNGGIEVRWSENGEPLELLNGTTVKLQSQTLVIGDHRQPLAMAGIMGGEQSSVTDDTRHLFLESAFFNPLAIAGKARSYGLHTDSSHRFERGVDPELSAVAIERATRLILEIMGGDAGPVIVAEDIEQLPPRNAITLRRARLEQQLGISFSDEQVVDILTRLGMAVTVSEQGWTGIAPSWRFDVAIEQDLVEEIARIYGYNNLPVATPKMGVAIEPKDERTIALHRLRDQLIARGYQEAITYSFVDPKLHQLLMPGQTAVALSNPISADLAEMRVSLWPGLVGAALHNLKRQQSRVRIFETGLRFVTVDGELTQRPGIAGLICGARHPENWASSNEKVDFFDIKADVEALLAMTGHTNAFTFRAAEHSALHPGQCAAIESAGLTIGYVGALHPQALKALDCSQALYVFELDLAAVSLARLPKFVEIGKFPEVRRDLAFFFDNAVSAKEILETTRSAAGSLLTELKLFDLYHSKDIENTGKSVALGLTFRDSSRTLSDEEVNECVDKVISRLTASLGATLRG